MSSEVIITTTPENETLLAKKKPKHTHHSTCKHHHYHGDKADGWTNLSSVNEFACTFLSTAYWSGGSIDLVFGLQANAFGLSYIAIITGGVMGVLVAICTMYAHRVLNVHHQEAEPNTPNSTVSVPDEKDAEGAKSTTPEAKKAPAKLTRGQYVALGGDFVSHALEYTAPLTFVLTLAFGSGLALWAKCLIQFLPLLVGAVCGWANVRSCKQAMLKQNEKEGHTAPACAT